MIYNYSKKTVSGLRKILFLGIMLSILPAWVSAQSVSINIPYGSTPNSSWSPWVYSFNDPVPAGATVTGAKLTFSGRDQGWGGSGGWAQFYLTDTHIGGVQLWHHTTSNTVESTKCYPTYINGGTNTLKMYFYGYPGWQGFFFGGTLTLYYQFVTPLEITSEVANNVTCNGASDGNISLAHTGGSQPVSVLWSNGATTDNISGLAPGTYTADITDLCGNTISRTFTITQPDELLVEAGENQMVFLGYAPAETANLTSMPTGGVEPYSYEWSLEGGASAGSGLTLTVNPTETTSYFLTVTDANGCVATDAVSVCVVDIAVPGKKGKASKKVYLCHIPKGNPANAHTISVSVNAVPDHLAHGDLLGPCGTPQSCDDSFKSGVADAFTDLPAVIENYLSIYPNPSYGEATVEFFLTSDVKTKVSVIDITGHTVEVLFDEYVSLDRKSTVRVNTQSLSKGVYFVRLQSSDGTLETAKLIVN